MAAIQGSGLDPSNTDGAKVLASALAVNRTRRSDGRDHRGLPSDASPDSLPGLRSWIAQSIGIPRWDERESRPATSILIGQVRASVSGICRLASSGPATSGAGTR